MQVKQTLNPDITTCVKCKKSYPTSDHLFSEIVDGIKEVTLVCPHCQFSYHVFYTNDEFEARSQRLQVLFAKYQKSKHKHHLEEAQTAQDVYRRDFERFNKRLRAKRKPYRNKQI